VWRVGGLGGLGRRKKNDFLGVFLLKPITLCTLQTFDSGNKYGIFEYNNLVHLSINPNHLWWILFNCLLYIVASDHFCAIESTTKIAVETPQKNEDS
jgi:hypothetical protein